MSCPGPLDLERLLLGEAKPEVAAHAASCDLCAGRLAEMRADGERYRASPDARALRARLNARERTRWRVLPFAWAALLLPVAAAASLLLRPRSGNDFTSKGDGALRLLVARDGKTAAWDGGPLRRGDRVQLAWSSGEAAQVAVAGRADGQDTDLVFPAQGRGSVPVAAGTATGLGDSLAVDGSWRVLDLWALSDSSPFDAAALLPAFSHGSAPFRGRIEHLTLHLGP